MAKKRKNKTARPDAAVDYYKLKTQAVDDLVTADASNSPPVSKEELKRYGARKKSGIPESIKICFIKFWFPASVCWYMVWGLQILNPENQILILGIVNGMITDLLTNNAIRFFAVAEGANDRWLMFYKKRYASFVFNILYALLLSTLVLFIYAGVNVAITAAVGPAEEDYLRLEPVSCGLIYMACDVALVMIRNSIVKFLARRKKQES